ncbi:MAG TPA: regulatory protein RecX [Propionicimonas sp.]|jgi:regulatory protein|uniref:regulatory protein RecX n=1 Tax=Propionicimonas sp. TaxID=1955623 RepID=UPI002F406A64
MEGDEVEVPDGPDSDPYAVAREIALRQLTVRARTRVELARALARKQVPEEVAERVLDRLAEVGLIDDAVFARDWLAAGGRRQKSRRVLLGELAEKGVDRELIDEAAAELESERDYEVARGFAARKAASLAGLEPAVRYRRLAGALARRGFPSAVVAQVTREALAELRESDDFG